MGCPASIGPEVTLKAALKEAKPGQCLVILGDLLTLQERAAQIGLKKRQLAKVHWLKRSDEALEKQISRLGSTHEILAVQIAEELPAKDRKPGKVTPAAGQAQLHYVEEGYRLAHALGAPLVTAAVSKEAIAHCGLARARKFRGHTEWLESMDKAAYSVMCFTSERLITSLVTTHIPVRQIARALTPALVCRSIIELADLVVRLRGPGAAIAVSSLNPHAGEGELLGKEEGSLIAPGIEQARKILGRRAKVYGPIGAETAYRKAAQGGYDGVVAMYHDQATIPMKLLDFGGAVNVTQGLSIVRTSVDHGTAYDIAGQGIASEAGMRSAVAMGLALGAKKRRFSIVSLPASA